MDEMGEPVAAGGGSTPSTQTVALGAAAIKMAAVSCRRSDASTGEVAHSLQSKV